MKYEDRKTPGQDGTTRKCHYGDGKQPWDTGVELGWAPHFAALSILKYLRRAKDEEHSLESARVYYSWMCKYAVEEAKVYPRPGSGPWEKTIYALEKQLTKDEFNLLRNTKNETPPDTIC